MSDRYEQAILQAQAIVDLYHEYEEMKTGLIGVRFKANDTLTLVNALEQVILANSGIRHKSLIDARNLLDQIKAKLT